MLRLALCNSCQKFSTETIPLNVDTGSNCFLPEFFQWDSQQFSMSKTGKVTQAIPPQLLSGNVSNYSQYNWVTNMFPGDCHLITHVQSRFIESRVRAAKTTLSFCVSLTKTARESAELNPLTFNNQLQAFYLHEICSQHLITCVALTSSYLCPCTEIPGHKIEN